MSKSKNQNDASNGGNANRISSSVEELHLAALERGDDDFQTGRYLITYKDGAGEEALNSLKSQGMRVADARDFDEQAASLEDTGDAESFFLPEINVALVSGNAAQERNMGVQSEIAEDSPILSIDPEYFQFANQFASEFQEGVPETTEKTPSDYLRGFLKAAETIAHEMQQGSGSTELEIDQEVQVLGATWGLIACRVPTSPRSGLGIRVCVLDTGMDLRHPDFAGRSFNIRSFVGQPVQDLNGHGTHVIGTAAGPKAPAGAIPRYGIGWRAPIFVGKVLTNAGTGTMAGVLAGMNWAIANRCPVINMSLGAPIGVQPAYTAAGQAALNNNCLIIAAAGNRGGLPAGAPANSPTIMSVASLDKTLAPSSFSSVGKVNISGPGRDIFSSWPRPTRYNTISGTSMATPHVAGCAALWAQTSPNLRGIHLWRKLQATARRLPFPSSRVGAGLVQAPQF